MHLTPFQILTKEALDELQSSTDRAIAIVGAVLIDNGLRALITDHLRGDQVVENELFQHTGALGALGPKARLAYLMSLIDKHAYEDIVLIEHIRNRFAHRLECKKFSHTLIAKDIAKFSTNKISRTALNGKYPDGVPLKALFLMSLYSTVDLALGLPASNPNDIILRPI
jgi:DNA-binding MltR family transcriptional regulator